MDANTAELVLVFARLPEFSFTPFWVSSFCLLVKDTDSDRAVATEPAVDESYS